MKMDVTLLLIWLQMLAQIIYSRCSGMNKETQLQLLINPDHAVIWVAPYAVRSAGGDIPVTFQVDMGVQAYEGNFPAGANVVVRGDFQIAFGDTANWGGNLFQLSDTDGDTIYTGTFNAPASLAGNSYIFKYVIVNPPAGDNWESTPNRPFTVTAPSTTLPVAWFNNDSVYTTIYEVTNTLNFTADISGILGCWCWRCF